MPELIFITLEDVLAVHDEALIAFGGSPGIRDQGGLDSALNAPQNYYYYQEADILTCAAVYLHHISEAQAFIDGNKRTAVGVTLMFLLANNMGILDDQPGLYDLCMRVANHELDIEQIREALEIFVS